MKEFNAIHSIESIIVLVFSIAIVLLTVAFTNFAGGIESVLFLLLLFAIAIYLSSLSLQKIWISDKFIMLRGNFFITKKVEVKHIKEIFEDRSFITETGAEVMLWIKTKDNTKIGLIKPFFQRDWTEIEKEVEKITKMKVRKL